MEWVVNLQIIVWQKYAGEDFVRCILKWQSE